MNQENQVQKNIFSKNLNNWLNIKAKTQMDLMNDLQLSSATVSDWCNAKKYPRMGTVQMLADYFNIMKSDLIEEKSSKTDLVKIPILGYVRAGTPIEAVEEILGYEEIPADLAKTGEFFCLKAKGDSMFPYILENDVIVFRKQSDCEHGQICVVLVNGDEATIKVVRKENDGITLVPYNRMYAPMRFNNEEIENKPVTIVGTFVELRRKALAV